MVTLLPWRPLSLYQPTQPGRSPFLSAASGVVQVNNFLYVIADDENSLGIFPLSANEPGVLYPLLPQTLPLDHEERKAQKADFESLVAIPHHADFPQGALMALGSGSKQTRQQAVIAPFNSDKALASEVVSVDLGALYEELKSEIGKLNIEGTLVVEDEMWLFQRGNKKNHFNGCIRLPLSQFLAWTLPHSSYPRLTPNILQHDLGSINGIPLCFTDATRLPDGKIMFTAAAESTSATAPATKNVGSAIGTLDSAGNLLSLEQVEQAVKLEGICAAQASAKPEILLVSDADEDSQPAHFYYAVF